MEETAAPSSADREFDVVIPDPTPAMERDEDASPGAAVPAEDARQPSATAPAADGLVMPPQKASTSGALIAARTGASDQVASGVSPLVRRVAVGAGKAGLSIANGILLSRNAILNPVVSAALVAYESFRAVRDYRTGAVNALGYQTSGTDVALRIGKEVGMAGIGIGIGQAVGMLVGLSTIPIAGQIVLTAVLSVGVGICVGTLLTRHIDRLFARWQIRSQYGYPADEQGTRRRFEELLEERHDLSSLETCKIVQHYADYRVASGWESSNDIDDYRATGDIRHMPVSFQHFAVVQLQRKWGFLSDHRACKKVFRVLILQHHPDRGGDTEMAALLNRDYEIYAFCQGWDEDCQTLLNAESASVAGGPGRPKKRNVVVNFLRSLFRHSATTDTEASDLYQFGLLTLEAGTRSDLHRLDAAQELGDDDSNNQSFSAASGTPVEGGAAPAGASGAAKQRSIARVLSALQQTYQMTSEAITFGQLARAAEDREAWAAVRGEAILFNRMQCFIRVAQQRASLSPAPAFPPVREEDGVDGEDSEAAGGTLPCPEHVCRDFRWRTVWEAVERREQARAAIVKAVFSKETSEQLEAALNLWQSAQSLAQSYFKQCAAERQQEAHLASVGESDGTGQTLETLLSIQRRMQKLSREVSEPWRGKESEWTAGGIRGSSTLMEDMHEVGLTASYALAGEHAKTIIAPRIEECEAYFRAWDRRRHTTETVLRELRSAMTERQTWRQKQANNAVAAEGTDLALEELQQRIDNYTTQLILLQQHQAEADAKVAELVEVCTSHLPEALPVLSTLPSTCVRAVDRVGDGDKCPRRLLYERERTLMCYQRVEREAPNKMVQPSDAEEAFPHGLVRPNLFKAVYTDTLSGIASSCWLKSYFFPDKAESSLEDIDTDDDCSNNWATSDGEAPSTGSRGRNAVQVEILQQILDIELALSQGCHSKYVLSPTDVFCDPEKRRIFLQIPRGATQQRFSSIYEVRKRIQPLGLRWLLDAMQCLIDLHSCQLAHGRISLSNFTYDDFGNTALGFFDPARRPGSLRTTTTTSAAGLEAMEKEKDVVDFGAMLLSEVLPYLVGGTASPSPPPPSTQTCAKDEHVARLFREVGERLIGKEDPRWTLLQARTFVRRCVQFNFETDESVFLFTKRITHPAYWGPPRGLLPQLIAHEKHVKFVNSASEGTATAYLNINVPLWERYWTCRRAMCQGGRMGSYSMPPALQATVPILVCSDDCEVNERFLWFPCETEEEAWDLCQTGFPRVRRRAAPDGTDDTATRYKDTARLHLRIVPARGAAQRPSTWGVVCRVAVGTVVSTSANQSFAAPPPAESDEDDAGGVAAVSADKIAYASKRRCHLETQDEADIPALLVPCPWGRCYPEYVVRWD